MIGWLQKRFAKRQPPVFNVYAFQRSPLIGLLGWAVGSIVAGGLWLRFGDRFWRSVGAQFLIWGLIDGALAIGGLRNANRNAPLVEAGEIDRRAVNREARNLERILWFNTGMDVLYITIGKNLITKNPGKPRFQGAGWGVLIQGAFLLVLDLTFALATGRARRAHR